MGLSAAERVNSFGQTVNHDNRCGPFTGKASALVVVGDVTYDVNLNRIVGFIVIAQLCGALLFRAGVGVFKSIAFSMRFGLLYTLTTDFSPCPSFTVHCLLFTVYCFFLPCTFFLTTFVGKSCFFHLSGSKKTKQKLAMETPEFQKNLSNITKKGFTLNKVFFLDVSI